MGTGSKQHIQMLFEHEWDRSRLAEIYVISRDFDGTGPPFMTFESKVSCEGGEEEHSLEFEESEYLTQIAQIQRFIEEPELKAQISSEIKLCLRDAPGQQARGFVYSVPIYSNGNLVGIVAAMVTRQRLMVELTRGLDTEKAILINESNGVFLSRGNAASVPPGLIDLLQNQPVTEFFTQTSKMIDQGDWQTLWIPIDLVSDQRWWLSFSYQDQAQLRQVYGSTWSLKGMDSFTATLGIGLILAVLVHLAVRWNEEKYKRLQEQKRIEEVLQSIAEGTSGKVGGDFFNSLVEELARALGVKYALVGELIGENKRSIATLAVWAGDGLTDNMEYDLAGTPCENVVGKELCLYHSGIQELFPKDILLQHMGAIGYMGIPLFTSSGEAMGILAILDDKPLGFEERLGERLLTIFGARVAAELETFRALRALQESEERFRGLFEEAPLAYQSLDESGVLVEVNQAWCAMLGYSREEVIGQPFGKFLTPEYQEIIKTRFPEFERTELICDLEFDFVRSDGSKVQVSINGQIGHNPDGSFRQTHCILTDITKRKQAEEQLNRLGTAIQQAAETVVITDTEGTILYVNPAFCSITGYSEKEALGQNPRILSGGHHDEAFYKELWDSITSGQPWHGRFKNKKKDGTLYHEEATISPVLGPGGKIINYVAVKRDITHEVSLEEQLRQTQKMEAIGTLAGGIAHDFNNILFAILGYAELASDDIPEGHPANKSLDQITTAGKRAAELVKQILTFSRRAEKQKLAINVASIAKETVKMLRASLPTTIGINLRLNTAESTIMADPTEIHQVIMNLCTNAGHAMLEQGGELEVGLSTIEVDELVKQQSPDLDEGPHLVLSVSDSGPGIPPDVLGNIFEPFFTTKEAGEGTGMGLAVVHGIILDLGGAINVESEVGKGTSFKLFIPLVDADESLGGKEARDIPGGTESVLVVDDEPAISLMLAEILQGLGYTVEAFTDSQAALEAYLDSPNDFDLVITDQTMGKLTGGDLAKAIFVDHPDQPVVLITGFSHILSQEKAEEMGITAYITKPVSKEPLAVAVRQALDRVL